MLLSADVSREPQFVIMHDKITSRSCEGDEYVGKLSPSWSVVHASDNT